MHRAISHCESRSPLFKPCFEMSEELDDEGMSRHDTGSLS